MAACFGLWGLLIVSGLRFVNGINTVTGAFSYTVLTASINPGSITGTADPTVTVLAWAFFSFGFLALWFSFKILGENNWQLKAG